MKMFGQQEGCDGVCTWTEAADVARMTEPTTSQGTRSKTLCGLWHVIVAMPACSKFELAAEKVYHLLLE
jgi:hypothetical protein